MTSRLVVLTVGACSTLILASATPASAAPTVRCGQVLTSNFTLERDLVGCPGDGLVVAAPGLTINLNHHRLSGKGTTGSAGVHSDGYANLRVLGGRLEHFNAGIDFRNANHLTVAHAKLSDNNFGVLVVHSTHGSIKHNTVTDAEAAGVQLASASGYTITRNELSHNGDGISLYESSHNQILNNTSSDSGAGISLANDSNHNAIVHNVTNREQDTGVLLDRHADDNLILGNRANGSQFAGIAIGASNRNQLRHNHTNRNLGSGIDVDNGARDTQVIGNHAERNGTSPPRCVPDCPLLDDGIHIDPGSTVLAPTANTVLTANHASRNADLGIEAPVGVTDGGRNKARHNGDPRQCVNVRCH